MASDAEIEAAADELIGTIDDEAEDTGTWSQDESAQIYETIADHCQMRARLIREEMGE